MFVFLSHFSSGDPDICTTSIMARNKIKAWLRTPMKSRKLLIKMANLRGRIVTSDTSIVAAAVKAHTRLVAMDQGANRPTIPQSLELRQVLVQLKKAMQLIIQLKESKSQALRQAQFWKQRYEKELVKNKELIAEHERLGKWMSAAPPGPAPPRMPPPEHLSRTAKKVKQHPIGQSISKG